MIAIVAWDRCSGFAIGIFVAHTEGGTEVSVVAWSSLGHRSLDTANIGHTGDAVRAWSFGAFKWIAGGTGSEVTAVVHCALVAVVAWAVGELLVDHFTFDAEIFGAVIVVVQIDGFTLNAGSIFAGVTGGTVVVAVDTEGTIFDCFMVADRVVVYAGA